jgi:hypothetical protein
MHATPARRDVVPELVHENQHAKHDDEGGGTAKHIKHWWKDFLF